MLFINFAAPTNDKPRNTRQVNAILFLNSTNDIDTKRYWTSQDSEDTIHQIIIPIQAIWGYQNSMSVSLPKFSDI